MYIGLVYVRALSLSPCVCVSCKWFRSPFDLSDEREERDKGK